MGRSVVVLLFAWGLLGARVQSAPATRASKDAWPLIEKAIKRVEQGYHTGIMSPAASSLTSCGERG